MRGARGRWPRPQMNWPYGMSRLLAALRSAARAWLPPSSAAWLRRLAGRGVVEVVGEGGERKMKPDWEMVPDTDDAWTSSAGWAHQSITTRQAAKWPAFVESLGGGRPLGRSHEAEPDSPLDVTAHNTAMTFGYVLGRCIAESRDGPTSVLDWGGGIGHYYLYARHLFPRARLDYTVKELASLCRMGTALNKGAKFLDDECEVLSLPYDLVFASSSLHYTRDIYGLTARLCAAAAGYLFVTRTPFVDEAPDFVVVQRPYRYGYHTEYAGWFLNRSRFIGFVEDRGFELDREFMLAERPHVPNAPEQCTYRGFLFRRVRGGGIADRRWQPGE